VIFNIHLKIDLLISSNCSCRVSWTV